MQSIFSSALSILLIVMTLCTLTSCKSNGRYYCVEGIDEFVTDSYQIRQGKIAILDMEGVCLEELPEDAMDEYVDSVYEDDILNIVVYHPFRRDLMQSIQLVNDTIGFRVVNGYVDVPDLAPIEVAGLTLDEARNLIQCMYREQISDIEVFVSYKDRLSRKVDLIGLVGAPYIPVDGKIRLYEVISKAHIAPNANLFMSYVLRDDKPLPIDLHRLINLGDMSQNIVMKGGDKIFIASPSDARIMIMGEVNRPIPIDLPYGFMSLREALVVAGGIPFTGDKRFIQVIRGSLLKPKIYQLSWEHITYLPNDSLLLIPGDTVYVSATAITEWNRFISQLLPSFSGIQSGWSTYRIVTN